MQTNVTNETIQLIKSMQAQDLSLLRPGNLQKAFTQALGLVWYDLEPTAKLLYPIITPIRNMIPRVSGAGGTATHYKAITGINVNNLSAGVSEGNRNAVNVTNVAQVIVPFAGLGFEDAVSFEADLASKNFDDVKALAVLGLLRALMIYEEKCMLWGNATLALMNGAATPTPAQGVVTNAGGAFSNGTYQVGVVALTPEGYFNASIAGGIKQQINRINTDGTNDTYGGGAARPSAVAAITLKGGGAAQILTLAVTAVQGAVAYAWYWGTAAGNMLLSQITTVNAASILGNETQGTQLFNGLAAVDYSRNTLLFDGLIMQAAGAGLVSGAEGPIAGAYYATLNGGLLHTNTAGGVTEIDTALKAFWDNYRLSPDIMFVNSQELQNITVRVISAGAGSLVRFALDAQNQANAPSNLSMAAGVVVGSYLNKFSMDGGQLVKIMLHPNMPPGTILFFTSKIPYPLSNVTNVLQMKLRRDYYQIEWPIRRRQYEYGIYMDGTLENYFPPAFGIICNIGNG
jgi:hypothetical protein